MAKRRGKANKSTRDLFCYGCMNSDDDAGFPGCPNPTLGQFSPCHMCMRSPEVRQLIAWNEPLLYTKWPNGSNPVGLPMDCYCTMDMADQTQQWIEEAVEDETQRQTKAEIESIRREYGGT